MGNLLVLNFGTFAETHRFKAQALAGGFVAADAMDLEPPRGLLVKGGVQQRPKDLGAEVVSFYGLTSAAWGGRTVDGSPYQDSFGLWINKVVGKPVSCLYMTGHHWDDHSRAAKSSFLSWGEDTAHFHAEFDRGKFALHMGVPRTKARRVEVDTSNLRSSCRLVLGFGCNVATGINSTRYQTFFGSPQPIVLGWDGNVSVPPRKGPSVAERFFRYLDDFATRSGKVPKDDRLEWFYVNAPEELVDAWGHATIVWLSSRARARDEKGQLWCFKGDKKADTFTKRKC